MRQTRFFFCLLAVCAAACRADTTAAAARKESERAANTKAKQQIAAIVDHVCKNGMFNGVIIVMKDGEQIFEKACGIADHNGKAMSRDSNFYLASVSKQLTAFGVLLLVEEGKLNLDDQVGKHLPEQPAFVKSLTIRQLLTHTAGLPEYLDSEFAGAGMTNADVMRFVATLTEPEFTPGSKFAYSNTGYALAARIIERVSNRTLYQFMSKRIFQPIGMKSAVVYDETKPQLRHKVEPFDRYGQPNDYTLFTTGAGGIYCSAPDFLKWLRAMIAGELLTKHEPRIAWTPHKLNDGTMSPYGLGWHIHGDDPVKIHHTGGMAGFVNFVFVDPASRHALIMFSNHSASFPMGATATAITNVLYDRAYELPAKSAAIHLYPQAMSGDLNALRDEYKRISSAENEDAYYFNEDELVHLGYALLDEEKPKSAVAVFKIAVDKFPDAYNAHDSYAEALADIGEYEGAIYHYKRSLELEPKNDNATQMIKQIMARSGAKEKKP